MSPAALAAGFEVTAHIARTAVGLESVRGFHNSGTQGPLGAVVAVGKQYGFDQETLVSAMGLAGSCSNVGYFIGDASSASSEKTRLAVIHTCAGAGWGRRMPQAQETRHPHVRGDGLALCGLED